jgi:hypothetical protein
VLHFKLEFSDPFLLEKIKKAIDELLYGKNKLFKLHDYTDYEKSQKEVAELFQDLLLKELGEKFYIFSSTQHHDDYEKDHGSLVMWRGYGKKNGCSIVFDKNQLESIGKAGQKQKKYGIFICDKVKYLHANDKEKIEKAFRKKYPNFYKNLHINFKEIFKAHIGEKYESEKKEDPLKMKSAAEIYFEEIEQMYNNIKVLNEIGQEITSTLNIEQVLDTVYSKVNSLMDATEFGVIDMSIRFITNQHCIILFADSNNLRYDFFRINSSSWIVWIYK